MLDGERRDLDVWDIVAAQARCLGEFCSDRRVSSTSRYEPDRGLFEIGSYHAPPLPDRDGVFSEHPRACDEAKECVDDRPAEGNSSLAFPEALLNPSAGAIVLRRVLERRVDEQVRVDERHVTPRCARRSSSRVASSADTSDTSRIGRPGSSGNAGATEGGAARALLRRRRLTAARNDSPVRARSLSIRAVTSSSSVIVVRMMSEL